MSRRAQRNVIASDAAQAMDDRVLEETRYLLAQWGLWLHQSSGKPLGYTSTIADLLRRSSDRDARGGPPDADISDDLALRIDRAICELRARRFRVGHAIIVYYSDYRRSHQALADYLRITKRDAQALLLAGEHWIDARLHGAADPVS